MHGSRWMQVFVWSSPKQQKIWISFFFPIFLATPIRKEKENEISIILISMYSNLPLKAWEN